MITKQNEQILLGVLDTLDRAAWAERIHKAAGCVDPQSEAVQAVAMVLAQMRNTNVLNDDKALQDSRVSMIQAYAPHLPPAYQYREPRLGCMGCETVADEEVNFAVETVLAGLVKHHECVPESLLSKYMLPTWLSETRPALAAAVRLVLETRNAYNF
jgi:hypothetical protein